MSPQPTPGKSLNRATDAALLQVGTPAFLAANITARFSISSRHGQFEGCHKAAKLAQQSLCAIMSGYGAYNAHQCHCPAFHVFADLGRSGTDPNAERSYRARLAVVPIGRCR